MFGMYHRYFNDWLHREQQLKESGITHKNIIKALSSYIITIDTEIERLTKDRDKLKERLKELKSRS